MASREEAQVIGRIVGVAMLNGVLWVSVMVVGLVAVAVTAEMGTQGFDAVIKATMVHVLVALIWLGPMIVGLGNALALLRMKSRGELRALSMMGVGYGQLVPVLASVGVLVGVLGWCLAEWVLPGVYGAQPPLWVWTEHGPWQPSSGVGVRVSDGTAFQMQAGIDWIQRSEPRMAPWGLLRWDGSAAEVTELWARGSRLATCVGLSILSLSAVRLARPILSLVAAGILLLVLETVAWAMGAQGQMSPFLAGTVGVWSWGFVGLGFWVQSSTRIHRPV